MVKGTERVVGPGMAGAGEEGLRGSRKGIPRVMEMVCALRGV